MLAIKKQIVVTMAKRHLRRLPRSVEHMQNYGTCFTESVTNDHDQPQLNCWRKCIIAGDSTLKYLQGQKMFRNKSSQNSHFPRMQDARHEG